MLVLKPPKENAATNGIVKKLVGRGSTMKKEKRSKKRLQCPVQCAEHWASAFPGRPSELAL